jgi:PAS domain S-box-containing protein
MSESANPVADTFRRASNWTGIGTMAIAGVVLIGWLFNIPWLQTIIPGFVPMKANTALALVLCGAALWLSRERHPAEDDDVKPQRAALARRVAVGCAVAAALIGAITLCEYLFRWQHGIDEWLAIDTRTGDPKPGRMAPISALSFVLIGVALLLLDTRGGIDALAIGSFAASLVIFVGFLYGDEALRSLGSHQVQRPLTSVLLLALSQGILWARPERGLMRIVASQTAAGVTARRILPAAGGAIILLGALRLWGQRAGLYGTEFGLAMMVLVSLLCVTGLVLWSATSLERMERTRQEADRTLRDNERIMRGLFEHLPDALIVTDERGQIVRVNIAAARMFGYTADEMLRQPVEMLIPERFCDSHRRARACYSLQPRRRSMGEGLELRGLRKDGGEIPLDIMLHPLEGADEGLILAVARSAPPRTAGEKSSS